ncbi:PTS sugar transporter [Companilactobacillus farciminis]|nr:PTS sugar transporter [Companilactobacillus farciminis]
MNTDINLIISGHGGFATGMKAALHLLSEIPENWTFIDFKEGMSDSDLKSEFEKVLSNKKDQQFVIFTDLVGGTPYKVAATLAYANDTIQTVGGCNLGSLLESIYSHFDNAEEMADSFVEVAKRGIEKFSIEPDASSQEPDEDSDGI